LVQPESDRNALRPCRRFLAGLVLPVLVALLVVGLWGFSGRAVSSAPVMLLGGQARISPWVREGTAGGARTDVLVVLKERADLGPAFSLPTKAERGRWVREALWQTAQRSQGPLQAWLEARRVGYRAFYIVNVIHVPAADWSLVEALAARPEVARIEANPRVRGVDLESPAREWGYQFPEGAEWNLLRVSADDVWAMGYRGQGMVIGGQDTGYQWDHPALVGQYREAQPGHGRHDYNWHRSGGRWQCQSGWGGAGRALDRLPQHGAGLGHAGHVSGVLSVLPGALSGWRQAGAGRA
jgi:subtilisin family serine protease